MLLTYGSLCFSRKLRDRPMRRQGSWKPSHEYFVGYKMG